MLLELRPPLHRDKGTAAAEFARRMAAAALICIGDDTTDVDMFRVVQKLRAEGTPGAAIAVGSAEATAEVLANADYVVDGVEGVEWLLEETVRALRETGP
jgi:trehalose 6-phosphate phosphatase